MKKTLYELIIAEIGNKKRGSFMASFKLRGFKLGEISTGWTF
jgi:hypothetical protein